MANTGDLRVWWIPQRIMEGFYVNVSDVEQAIKILEVLADYDEFQYFHNVKPDYSNVGGLQVFDGDEWVEWYSVDGFDIDDYRGEVYARPNH